MLWPFIKKLGKVFSIRKNKIKFLAETRKNSLGYTELGRKSYAPTRPATVTKLIEQMSITEVNKLKTISEQIQKQKNKGRESSVLERVIPPCNSLKREADDESRSAASGLDSD